MPKPTKIGLPANSSPAIAVITVRPEIEHRAARGGGGDLHRGLGRVAAVALLHDAT